MLKSLWTLFQVVDSFLWAAVTKYHRLGDVSCLSLQNPLLPPSSCSLLWPQRHASSLYHTHSCFRPVVLACSSVYKPLSLNYPESNILIYFRTAQISTPQMTFHNKPMLNTQILFPSTF